VDQIIQDPQIVLRAIHAPSPVQRILNVFPGQSCLENRHHGVCDCNEEKIVFANFN
jgi:hypothetical protein